MSLMSLHLSKSVYFSSLKGFLNSLVFLIFLIFFMFLKFCQFYKGVFFNTLCGSNPTKFNIGL